MAEGEQSQTSKGQVGPWILVGPSILVGGGDPRSEIHYLGRVSRLFLLLKLVHGVN